jgi:hypothetical protein
LQESFRRGAAPEEILSLTSGRSVTDRDGELFEKSEAVKVT